MTVPAPLPRLLLAEDDPVSAAFFIATLETLPVRIDHATGIADAQRLADANRHALWLIDAHLADGSGIELLARLRARCPDTPALAHTAADGDAQRERRLLDAGFAAVLHKPITPPRLLAAVRGLIPAVTSPPAGDWDDDAALKALNGQSAHVKALRELFLSELPGVRERVVLGAQAGNVDALRAELHRLQASCGFVGAVRMGNAVTALRSQADSPAALTNLLAAIDAMLKPDIAGPR